MSHLSIVPKPKPKFSLKCIGIAQIKDDLFICREGVWEICADVETICELVRAEFSEAAQTSPLPWPICAEYAGDRL